MKIHGFGLIGCGRIAKNHLQAISSHKYARLAAVCDIDAGRLAEVKEQYGSTAYIDYREMIKDPKIEIVNICTPSGLHAKMAIEAMNAGKHVLVEKPMAMSLHEANAMIDAADQNGVKLGVVHQNRFNKAIVKVRQALEEGRFGKLTHGALTVRWHRDKNYYDQAPWRGTWAQDGGCLMNQSIHNIDLLQWMMGPVESVFAYTATNAREIEGEDAAVAVLRFKNGAFATIEASTTVYPRNLEETLHIFGTTGTAGVGGVAVNKIEAWRFEGVDEAAVLTDQDKEPPNVYGFGHYDIIKDFIDAVDGGRQPAVPGAEGCKALEIILAIYHSVKYREEVKLPLTEKFMIGVGL
ncbi:Gfo/Idh/MocA family protein [Anaeroselena agilis]|uniref:Gfo/Idh/MocA family oxidoreductase n=1 Tax=Anaeroselena agilis TaxID=3063788 RepID=A0ABU3P6Q1_9FIRM|nr:Gfo/Idh/MocA family oxidoreductase [Selenomonadales bacterium 4137-cl]